MTQPMYVILVEEDGHDLGAISRVSVYSGKAQFDVVVGDTDPERFTPAKAEKMLLILRRAFQHYYKFTLMDA